MEIIIFIGGLALGAIAVYIFSTKIVRYQVVNLISQLKDANLRIVERDEEQKQEREKTIDLERRLAKSESDKIGRAHV